MLCRLGRHRVDPAIAWNGGIGFSHCRACRADLIQRPGIGWTRVPRGYAVVWRPVTDRPVAAVTTDTPLSALSGNVRRIGRMLGKTLAGRIVRSADPAPVSRDYRYLARRAGDARVLLLSGQCDAAAANDAMLMLAAMVQDEHGGRVLLIDATLSDDGVGAMLGAAGAPGLSEVQADQPWSAVEAMRLLARPGMILLGAGLRPEAGRPDRIATMLPFLTERFDRILIQQHGIGADSRNLSLAQQADRIWIVAEEGRSPMAALRTARDAFHANGMDDVALVLTTPTVAAHG